MKYFAILLAVFLSACEMPPNPEKENRLKYAKEIRETTKECLTSVRSNPQVQNFTDDNEIVEQCTDYAMKIYNAYISGEI